MFISTFQTEGHTTPHNSHIHISISRTLDTYYTYSGLIDDIDDDDQLSVQVTGVDDADTTDLY